MDTQDLWLTQFLNLCGASGLGLLNNRSTVVRRTMHDAAVAKSLLIMREQTSLLCMPQPDGWFKLQKHVSDSSLCGVQSRFRAGDTGLGNRRPNLAGKTYKTCPLCLAKGATKVLNEVHVGLQCRSVSYDGNFGLCRNLLKHEETPPRTKGLLGRRRR